MKLEVKLEIEEENGVQNKPTDDLQNELMNEPSFDYEFSDEYAHITISGQSRNPRKIYEELDGVTYE